jgi:hypothetical protein
MVFICREESGEQLSHCPSGFHNNNMSVSVLLLSELSNLAAILLSKDTKQFEEREIPHRNRMEERKRRRRVFGGRVFDSLDSLVEEAPSSHVSSMNISGSVVEPHWLPCLSTPDFFFPFLLEVDPAAQQAPQI